MSVLEGVCGWREGGWGNRIDGACGASCACAGQSRVAPPVSPLGSPPLPRPELCSHAPFPPRFEPRALCARVRSRSRRAGRRGARRLAARALRPDAPVGALRPDDRRLDQPRRPWRRVHQGQAPRGVLQGPPLRRTRPRARGPEAAARRHLPRDGPVRQAGRGSVRLEADPKHRPQDAPHGDGRRPGAPPRIGFTDRVSPFCHPPADRPASPARSCTRQS